MSHSAVPAAGDTAAALLRAIRQLAEGACCCCVLHVSLESPVAPAPSTGRMLPTLPQGCWVLPLTLGDRPAARLEDGPANPCDSRGWMLEGDREDYLWLCQESRTKRGFGSRFSLSYVRMEEFLSTFKCPQGGKEQTQCLLNVTDWDQ